MSKKSGPPPPPDYGPIIKANAASSAQAQRLAQAQFDWAKKVYNQNRGLVNQVNQSFLKSMQEARTASEEDRQRYKDVFQPLEDKFIADANSYDSPERRDQAIGSAQSGVGQQYQAARDSATRQLESFGVNPSATRFAALDIGMRASEAASKAAAGTNASNRVEDTARNMRGQAIAMGQGLPMQAINENSSSMNAGQGAVGNANSTYATGSAAMGSPTQWAGIGQQGLANWGNLLNSQYSNQMDYYKAQQQQQSGFGQLLGLGAGMALNYFGMPSFGGGPSAPAGLFKHGGAIPEDASPSHGAIDDDVPARLSAGEMVIPAEAVKWYGEKHFYGLMEKANKDMAERRAIPLRDAGRQAVPA